MKQRPSRHLVRYALTLLALLIMALQLVTGPSTPASPLIAFLSAVIVALLANFAIQFTRSHGNLVHTVSIAAGLAIGPGEAALGLFSGLLAGNLVRFFWQGGPSFCPAGRADRWSQIAFDWAYQGLSLFAGVAVFRALAGRPLLGEPDSGLLALAGFLLAFLIVHVLLFLLGLYLQGEAPAEFLQQNLIPYAMHELLPLPLGVIAAYLLSSLGLPAFISLGGLTVAIAIVVHTLTRDRARLEQRLRELSTIDRVSRAMRTSLHLDDLLDTIYLQVAHVLGVRNMYVALYDPNTELLTYPLAVRNGKRQAWAARPGASRLTDWVINTSTPLLIPSDMSSALKRMGLEEGGAQPEAWLGVPLLAADRALGCLAVFATQSGETFGQKDLALLSTLGAQASVAVENAQLYGETKRRAAELATLNEISALMSATLNPERILELVCSSVIRVVGGQKSAIFLRDPERDELWLARAEGLSQDFMQASLTLALDNNERVRSVTTRAPEIVSDILRNPNMNGEMHRLAASEGFRAYAELPLQAQGSMIGFLAVYFSEPHNFPPAEVDLLKTFASQAALAVSNARLYASTDQALARRVAQLSALEAIARELIATLDLGRLFDTILGRAMLFTEVEIGSLALYDRASDTLTIVASRGYSGPEMPHFGQSLPSTSSVTGRAIREGVTINARDVRLEPDYLDLSEGKARSQLSVPIMREGRSLGVITLESTRLAAFSSDDEQFIAQLAAHAAIAIDNAHLYEEVHVRLREQSILYEAGAKIASTLEAQTVLNTVALGLAQVLSAEGVTIFDWDEETGTLSSVANFRAGRIAEQDQGRHLTGRLADYPQIRRTLEERQCTAARTDDPAASPHERQLLESLGYGALLAVPMISADRAVGLVEIYTAHPRAFSQNEIRLAQTLVNQAAIAAENARLFQRVTEGRDRLAAVLNSTREAVLMIDASGRIALANPRVEMLFDIPRERLEGQLLSELLSSPDIPIAAWLGYTPEDLAALADQLSEGSLPAIQKVDYPIQFPRPRFLQRSGSPVRDDTGAAIGWVMVLRDITEDKDLEEAREDLTSMIVHDLRSPLTAVVGALSLIGDLLKKEMRGGVVQQAMEVSMRSCKKLLNLVDSMLDISRLETGEVRLERRPARLHKVVEEVVIDMAPLANDQGVILHNNIPSDVPEVRVDEEKLGRVFTNLLDNALKFTPPGGQVVVECLANGYEVLTCKVSDSGPGIPEEYRDRVFDRFVQVPGRMGRRKGSGLGLAFVKLAVEAHGGQVWVENRPEGGSVFAFTLPMRGSARDIALE